MKRYPGVYPAIVKSLNDPQGIGRIEVEVKKIPEAIRSSLARVAAPMAGNDRGAFLMPEIDDECLVAFEDGDFDHPYILGFLWNGVDVPPETTNQNRIIRTPGRHELRFEDTDGQKKVVLKSAGGHRIEIDDSAATVTVKTDSGNQFIELNDATQSVTIRGGQRMVKMIGGLIVMT